MIKLLKSIYFPIKFRYQKLCFFLTVNWVKTLYFNFKMLPFHTAKKLPFFFYGKVKLSCLKGRVHIDGPITMAMIGFGQNYEMITKFSETSELNIQGEITFKGHMQFGKNYFVYVTPDGVCEFGHMASLASNGKIICTNSVVLGTYARLGSECQIIDTNFHQLKDTITGEIYPKSQPIKIGDYNFISNRVSVLSKTVTPNNCIIASNSVCSKNYTQLGEHILIGGMPAKLIKEQISRDWEAEKERMELHLIKQYIFK